jgi:hypothetical protein
MLGATYDQMHRLELGPLDIVRSGAISGLGLGLPRIAPAQRDIEDGKLVMLDSLTTCDRPPQWAACATLWSPFEAFGSRVIERVEGSDATGEPDAEV